ncbi:cobalt ABC transporter permease [Xanthobacter sp. TB0139]|uniref:cobalt ABC transporter permease n=1 Tax=Xanthobacter sp. TB0139 TaxID=3459178 RepID=UPI0040392F8C
MKTHLFSGIVALLLALSTPAFAHKVIASVYAEGDVISGDIGFSNGDMAQDVPVEIFDPQGNRLGEVKTDEDGLFTFRPTRAVAHIFRANLGGGHVAEVRMEADELPAISGAAPAAAPAVQAGAAASLEETPTALTMAAQEKLIATVVQKQIVPLRREIAAYQEKTNLQNVLGGIGYILGLFGLGFYLAARRKLARG